MKRPFRIVTTFAGALCFCLQGHIRAQPDGSSAPAPSEKQSITVLTGARLIDGTGRAPVEDAALVVEGDRIASVAKAGDGFVPPAGARIIDLHGRTIIPGLVSAHSHLGLTKGKSAASPENYTRDNVARQLDQYEAYGVTGVMSLGVNRDALYNWREEQRRGELGGADIFTADRGLGVPPFPVPAEQVYRPDTAEQARAAVREMTTRHPDLIKIWLDDVFGTLPKMEPPIFRAVIDEAHAAVDEAHAHGLRVAAHIFYLADATALVDAGVDILAHSVRDKPVDSGLITAMKARGVAYIPTLALDESQYVYAEHPRWMDERAFIAAVDPELLAAWLAPEYAAKTLSNPSTRKNRAAFEMAVKNVKTPLTLASLS